MEDVCIAAPRPLRLFTPAVHRPRPRIHSAPAPAPVVEAFARFNLRDNDDDDPPSSSASALPEDATASLQETPEATAESSNASRSLSLSEETLDEFFAILRPQALSPPLRRRHAHHPHHGVNITGPSWVYDRPHPYKLGKKSLSSPTTTTTTTTATSEDRSRRGVGAHAGGRQSTAKTTTIVDSPMTSAMPSLDETPTHSHHQHHHSASSMTSDWRNFELGSPISRTHTRNPLPRHPAYETLTSNLIFSVQFSPPPRPSNNPIDFAAAAASAAASPPVADTDPSSTS